MFFLRPFIFIRHGETEWNRNNRLMGQSDIPLNEKGIQQAHQAKTLLKQVQISMLVHSPLQRCTQTAQILNEVLNIPAFVHTGFKEANLGDKEGHLKSDAISFQKWKQETNPCSGENYTSFQKRILASLEDVFTVSTRGLILIVAHGGVFEAIREAFQIPEYYLPCTTPVVVYPRFKAIPLTRKETVPNQ